jgi:PAS domain S-box-containing protein
MPEPDYAQVFDVAPAPLLLLDPDLTVVAANRAWLESTATTLERSVGRRLSDVFPGSLQNPLDESLRRVRETGRPDLVSAQRYDLPMPDGSVAERFWAFSTVPVLDERDDVVLLLLGIDDLTDSVRLEQANAELGALTEREQRTASTLAGLATTVSALSVAESRDELLRQLFRHGRRAFRADVLAVALQEPGGSHLAIVDNRTATGPESTRRLSVRSPTPMAAAAAGRPEFQEDAERGAGGPAPLPGLRSWATLPLHIGRRPLGSLTVGWEQPRVFRDDDVGVLEAFAAQCSQAVNRVARRETERRQAHATRSLAESLQRSLLTNPPELEHLDIAVRYRPAAREVQIGGDWYDAFLSPGGDTTLVVGDVTGHDWTAAAVAGQLRHMLRGIASALDHRNPQQVLSALDRALGETGIATLATAVVARIEEPPETAPDRARILRWSNAGHPPPVLLEPDGTATLLERPANLLLGVEPDAPRQHHAVELHPGATVVLFTDGLVERRDATLDEGLDRLLGVAHELAGRPVHELCDEILDRMDPDLTDDIALVALRVRDDERNGGAHVPSTG